MTRGIVAALALGSLAHNALASHAPSDTGAAAACPLNEGAQPMEHLPAPDVCAANGHGYYIEALMGSPATCPAPIGTNGERMHTWLPMGQTIEQRRVKPAKDGSNPHSWAPWTHRPECGRESKFCTFSLASLPGTGIGSHAEIVVENSRSINATNSTNVSKVSDWGDLSAADDKEAAFQGVSILTTPEMAAYGLHPHQFALYPDALKHFDEFARMPPAYAIQRIPDLAEVAFVEDDTKQAVTVKTAHDDDNGKIVDDDFGGIEIKDVDDNEDEDDDLVIVDDDFGGIHLDGDDEKDAVAKAVKTKRAVALSTSKGWGAVAVRDIRAGEAIVVERPAILAHNKLFVNEDEAESYITYEEDDHGLGKESIEDRARLWKAAVDNLSPATAERIRGMHILPKYQAEKPEQPEKTEALLDIDDNEEFEDADSEYSYRNDPANLSLEEKIFDSNAFAMSIDGYPMKALFPSTSIFNHACKPNLVASWSEIPMALTVWANRNIKKGEELTLNYLVDFPPHLKRNVLIAHRFGFSCQCDLCRAQRADPVERRASDIRRELLMTYIPQRLSVAFAAESPDIALELYLLARDVLTAEGIRQPGTVWNDDIGVAGGADGAEKTPRRAVADAFGPKNFAKVLGELLASVGDTQNALPHLRAALIEKLWRNAGWSSQEDDYDIWELQATIQALEQQQEATEDAAETTSAEDLPEAIGDLMSEFMAPVEGDDGNDDGSAIEKGNIYDFGDLDEELVEEQTGYDWDNSTYDDEDE